MKSSEVCLPSRLVDEIKNAVLAKDMQIDFYVYYCLLPSQTDTSDNIASFCNKHTEIYKSLHIHFYENTHAKVAAKMSVYPYNNVCTCMSMCSRLRF